MRVKKIKAFTLSEMLVVLLLTVIVVGLAFAILNLVQKQMNETRINYDTGTEINLLKQALWKDFRTHPDIYFNSIEQQLIFRNELDQVHYQFINNNIIRARDTFKIQLATKMLYFNEMKVESGKVTALKLILGKEIGGKSIFVYRQNAADIYMNN